MNYPTNIESKLGFHKIKESLAILCLSDLGKYHVDNLKYLTDFKQLNNILNQVNECKEICQNHDNFPVDNYFDLIKPLQKIKVEGTFLEIDELFALRRSQNTIKAISRFLSNNAEDFPTMNALAKNVKNFPFVTDRIDQILNKQGKIKDKASNELFNVRKAIANKHNTASKAVNNVLKKAIQDGIVEKDASLTIRDGRAVIPVSITYKRRINGLVHDVSATGKTAFIEPSEIVEINNAIKELEFAEKREIIKILHVFADDIRPYIPDLLNGYYFLGQIDFIRAKAILAIKQKALLPVLKNEQFIEWKNVVHPLLKKSLAREGKKPVPLNIVLNSNKRILLISGPNAGGKSVCLQTVGLLQYMLQCGLLVPMGENSVAGIFQHIYMDMGDEQSIENDLSTYSSHLLNMKYFIKNADESTLVLIDEFGSGTEPLLGGAIAESILNKLSNKNIFGVITTHYSNLKHFASSKENIVNGAMLYDMNKLQPLFTLEIGKPGSSFAFEIAQKIGLPNDVLENAKEKIGEEHIHFDKHLKEIIRDKRYWENKRQKIRKKEKHLEETLAKYGTELSETLQVRKQIIAEARLEADKILKESNKKIEKTIREIRENQAEKEKTKKLRKELEEHKSKLENASGDNSAFSKKLKQLKKKENQIKQFRPQTEQVSEKPDIDKNIAIGDYVRIKGQDSIGEVIDKGEKNLVVAFGQMITSIDSKKVEKVRAENVPIKKTTASKSNIITNMHEKRMNFKSGIDIRGKRVEDAIQIITDFIDDAIMLNIGEVKILHGKGTGVLRQVIRNYLRTIHGVQSLRDEHVDLGGSGITVVTLE